MCGFTRRSLLAAGAAGALSVGGLPAWARPMARAMAIRSPDSLPFPDCSIGTPSTPQIEHIVVLMLRDRSFDGLLGMVPIQVPGRRAVDGLTLRSGRGEAHRAAVAQPSGDGRTLAFTYALVGHFPIGQRYFAPTSGQAYPNRRFLFTGTSSGLLSTDRTTLTIRAANGTIWDRLDQAQVAWGIYYTTVPSCLIVPGVHSPARGRRLKTLPSFYADAATGRLPQFAFLDPGHDLGAQGADRLIAAVVRALSDAPTWRSTALFITYDAPGGHPDHVPPPRAIPPDTIRPIQPPGRPLLGRRPFARYGPRVPLIVVSPWARPGYVSRQVQDHTSITAFIERKWNLPAMTYRDANAQPMTDYFDYRRPAFARPPALLA